MNEIRAFVGHSFTDDDAEVVRKFTDYFDQLAKAHPNFQWQHALEAEPKNLTDKVIALLADKNVFIGICTRKERVIPPTARSRRSFMRRFLQVPEDACEWKTSDWIIQEIGLALGKNLTLILLVESGVRSPGSLQSNVEYIPFERERPEKCFGKILEMIGALSPRHAGEGGTALEVRSPPPDAPTDFDPTLENELVPKPEWCRRDYEFAYFRAIARGHTDKALEIDQTYLASEDASRDDNRHSWIATREFSGLLSSKGGSLDALREMAESHPQSSRTVEQFARALTLFKEHGQAGGEYEKAARPAGNSADRLRLMGRALVEFGRAGLREESDRVLKQMKGLACGTKECELRLLDALYELSEFEKSADLCCAILERILEIEPDNNLKRFSLAYKYSEVGNNNLSLFHYLRIPEDERESHMWNNLGVEFDRLGLVAKSVRAYQKAEEMGETLAMSNLSKKLIGAGFLDEAERLCRQALAIPDFHQNVALDLANLKSVPDKENTKQSELLETAKLSSDFLRRFGKAWSAPDTREFVGKWIDKTCELIPKVMTID